MSARDIIIIIGAISLPTIGCWFGILAIRYSLFGLQPHKKVVKILKVFTLQFIYISAVLWTIIYVSLGYASYRVFDCMRASGNGFDGEAKIAFTLYLVQLILHWAWIPIFVKFEPCYGICVCAAALLTAAGCAFAFGRIDLIAGLIFIPFIICAVFFSASLSGMLFVTAIFNIVGNIIGMKRANTVSQQSTDI